MSFKAGDIVATNHGGIGIYKGPSSKQGKVNFFITNCDSYNGKNFYLNQVLEKNLTLATSEHPKYKCIKCILGLAWSKKHSKNILNAFKEANPDIVIKTKEDGYREDNQRLLKMGLLSEEDIKLLKQKNLL